MTPGLTPASARAYYNRGNAKQARGHHAEAITDYQKALALAQAAGDEDLVATVKDNLRGRW